MQLQKNCTQDLQKTCRSTAQDFIPENPPSPQLSHRINLSVWQDLNTINTADLQNSIRTSSTLVSVWTYRAKRCHDRKCIFQERRRPLLGTQNVLLSAAQMAAKLSFLAKLPKLTRGALSGRRSFAGSCCLSGLSSSEVSELQGLHCTKKPSAARAVYASAYHLKRFR